MSNRVKDCNTVNKVKIITLKKWHCYNPKWMATQQLQPRRGGINITSKGDGVITPKGVTL